MAVWRIGNQLTGVFYLFYIKINGIYQVSRTRGIEVIVCRPLIGYFKLILHFDWIMLNLDYNHTQVQDMNVAIVSALKGIRHRIFLCLNDSDRFVSSNIIKFVVLFMSNILRYSPSIQKQIFTK